MKSKFLKPEIMAALLSAVVLIHILITEPIIGIADNGDFERIMGSTGLEYITDSYKERYFGYVNREYRMASPLSTWSGYFSTQAVPVLLAKIISRLFVPGKAIFDIRSLGFIYSCFFVLSLYLIIKYNRQSNPLLNWILAGLLVFVFTDSGYISYFNSLYGEAASFSALLLTSALAVYIIKRKNPGLPALIAFFLSAIFLTGSKAQNAPIGICLAVLGIRFIHLRKDFLWKRCIIYSCAVLLFTASFSYFSIPYGIRLCNKYQTVFYGVLRNSPNPERDLEELGLDTGLSVLAGTDFFANSYPLDIRDEEFLKEIDEKINPVKILSFYLKHPSRYLDKLRITSENGFKLVQGYGNFEKDEGRRFRETTSSFILWSNFKENVLPHSLIFTAVFFAIYILFLSAQYIKIKDSLSGRLYIELYAFLWLTGLIQFIVPVIGDGEADLSRHLFLFNVCFDIMLISAAVYIINLVVKYTAKFTADRRFYHGGDKG
ncbi:MAG: hypothetical protein ACOX7R_13805 [Acetivibrionales bacterium]|jgi:hypothetical protein